MSEPCFATGSRARSRRQSRCAAPVTWTSCSQRRTVVWRCGWLGCVVRSQAMLEGQWRSQRARDAFEAEGIRLAHRVADALGAGFVVEFEDNIVHSRRPPENLAAAAAFEDHDDREEAAFRRIAIQMQSRDDSCSEPRPQAAASVTEPGAWLRDVRSGTTRPVRVNLSPDLFVGSRSRSSWTADPDMCAHTCWASASH